MFKILLIAILSIYVLIKVGQFFFSLGRNRRFKTTRGAADYSEKKKSEKGTVKGGEYIDFEEVK